MKKWTVTATWGSGFMTLTATVMAMSKDDAIMQFARSPFSEACTHADTLSVYETPDMARTMGSAPEVAPGEKS